MKLYERVLILGYGRSGRAAEKLLRAEGCETVVCSNDSLSEADFFQTLETNEFDVCIVSPGFGLSNPWIKAVQKKGVRLLSELELGWSRHPGRTIAVTGSNGKSTAVKWICESLVEDGKNAVIGGNYGIPACEVVLENPELDWLVLEVSSFQLETVQEFRADVAVVLNVLPNHLDRHGTMACYRKIKARIFGPEKNPSGLCLAPQALLSIFRSDVPGKRNWVTFGDDGDFSYRNSEVFQGTERVLKLEKTLFDSPVIGGCTGAAMAAIAAGCGLAYRAVECAAQTFKPLPHRLQCIGEHEGVVFVNDSKATNLSAMAAALGACGQNIHLIAGGLPKESDYTFVKEILAERVRTLYLIGQASGAMFEAWNEVCFCVECGTLEGAFGKATETARAGDTLLLSPGCASFDQFNSFEERGDRFEKLFNRAKQAGNSAL
ncbi:MAG: UDP-N-acetylmuramoyl-L-alanine--D-glutamate ligase [Pontiella sp.]